MLCDERRAESVWSATGRGAGVEHGEPKDGGGRQGPRSVGVLKGNMRVAEAVRLKSHARTHTCTRTGAHA